MSSDNWCLMENDITIKTIKEINNGFRLRGYTRKYDISEIYGFNVKVTTLERLDELNGISDMHGTLLPNGHNFNELCILIYTGKRYILIECEIDDYAADYDELIFDNDIALNAEDKVTCSYPKSKIKGIENKELKQINVVIGGMLFPR